MHPFLISCVDKIMSTEGIQTGIQTDRKPDKVKPKHPPPPPTSFAGGINNNSILRLTLE